MNKTNLGKQEFQGACLLEWYCLLKHYIWGCVRFLWSVCRMDSIKAPSCPFESSLKQSHTVSVSQVNRGGGVDFVIGISSLLDLSITRALRQVPVVLYGWIDRSNDAWKTTVVGSILRPAKGALKEQSILLYEAHVERTNKARLVISTEHLNPPKRGRCRAVEWPSPATGSNLFFLPGLLLGSNDPKMISPCDHCVMRCYIVTLSARVILSLVGFSLACVLLVTL